MSLTNCPDCKNEVSTLAPACPNCGRPIAAEPDVKATGSQLTTTQLTAKSFKMQSALSITMLIFGILWIMNSHVDDDESKAIGALIALAGFAWYLINRLRSWWHHG